MSNPTANPLGAGGDVTKAAVKIGEILRNEKPQGQAQEKEPTVQANPTDKAKPADGEAKAKSSPEKDPQSGRFVRRAEPEAAEDEGEAKLLDVPEEDEAEEKPVKAEAEDDHEELAEDVEDLAKQLGLEPDDLLDHLKAKVKVNGEERRVNLKELLSGYSMESDYRTKTAKLAEERRQIDAERQQYLSQREHVSKELTPLIHTLQEMVVDDDTRLRQLLEAGDILEYERAKIAAADRRAKLDAANREKERIDGERAREARVQLERDVADNEHMLMKAHPEWAKDVEKGRRELGEIRQYLKENGVPGETVDQLYDANGLLLAEKAMKWDKMQKAKPEALKPLKTVPKFQKPGAAKPAEDPKKQVARASLQRLRKTGRTDDAAKAIKALGLVG